jgi:ankyrin repeat protein
MKQLLLFLFFSFIGFSCHSQDIFDVARKGTASEMIAIWEKSPEQLTKSNSDGYTPIILAAYHTNFDVLKVLVTKEVPLNDSSKYGSPLMAATVKGSVDIVDFLLNNGADPNLVDTNGTSALLYACLFQLTDIAKLLVAHDANVSLKDNRGNTAMDYATMTNNKILINLLKK